VQFVGAPAEETKSNEIKAELARLKVPMFDNYKRQANGDYKTKDTIRTHVNVGTRRNKAPSNTGASVLRGIVQRGRGGAVIAGGKLHID
jgi:hypothetical protein